MNSTARLFTALALIFAGLLAWPGVAVAQNVTSEGWAEKSADLAFYLEVPMIDNKKLKDYGIGGNITAESIINSVRSAANNPDIHHVVFMMDTGGGALHHAEAMEDIIERHHNNTEFHIVVQNAISAGIWTAFSCDTIFMCRAGTIGGATAYYQLSDDKVMVAGDIPEIAARLALTAERNGHPPQLIKPLMLMTSELHYWVDSDGNKVLSNTPPKGSSVTDHRHLDRKDTVLTLTTNDAIEIGIAQPIGKFDAALVGQEIGAPGWTRANRLGQIIDQIGWLYNTTRVWEDDKVQIQLALPSFPVTSFNRGNRLIREMLDKREKHAAVVAALRMMNQALNELPDVHPERHIYLAGDDGQTLLADPEQWTADARAARTHASRLNAGLRQLEEAYKKLNIDSRNLEDIQEPIKEIVAQINGIANMGNVAYWQKADK